MLECRTMPPSPSPPVDLILHAAAEALHSLTLTAIKDGNPDDAARAAAVRHGFTRAIRPEALAEEWNASGPITQIGAWIARVCTGDIAQKNRTYTGEGIAYGRAVEIAVARRLADTACSLTITGDSEDAAQAGSLWRAAGALVGLAAQPSGFKVPTPGEIAEYVHGRVSIDPLLQTLRRALGAEPHVDIVVAARAIKAQADRAGAYRDDRNSAWAQLDAVRVALGAQEGSDLPTHARLIKARAVDNEGLLAGCAKWQAERDAIAKALGVQPNTNLAVIADDARRERDAATEARAAMQAKLIEAERVADAAQEEARGLRAQIVNGPEEWNRAIAWAGRL
jgi:hypothetical protein